MGTIPAATLAAYAAAGSAVIGAGSLAYNMANKPKAAQVNQDAKNPDTNIYKDRNAQNSLIQGNAGTGTGSLLTSSSNVAGNSLFGQ